MRKNLLFLLGLSLVIGGLFYSSRPAQAAFGDTAAYLSKIYAGDGETALNAYLDMPQGFVMDAAGNIYIADNFNNVIRKIDTSNLVSTYSGTGEYGKADGARTSATWSWPEGITMDADGIIYVADTGSNKIRKIQGDTVTTLSIAGLKGPRAVIVSGTTLYISDTRNNRIVQVSTSGGTPTELATGLSSPSKIVLVGNTLYVADFGSGSIIAIDITTGTKTTLASGLTEPRAVAYYNGYLYVAGGENGVWNEIWRIYLADNSIVQLVKTRETTMLNAAADMFIREINGTPKIYQVHGGGSAIFTFDIDAQNSQQIAGRNRYGDEPGTRSVALLGRPKDLVFSPDGTKLYIVYSQGNKIAEYNLTTDQVTALAGFPRDSYVEGVGDAVRFSDVTSIAISNDGKTLYVIDRNNNRLRTLNIATKETHYLTGAGEINSNALTNNGYQEGGPCDNQLNKGVAGCAYFNRPIGIVITSDGKTIYLADVGNNRVRKVTVATGQTSLVAGSGAAGFTNGTGASASFNGPAALALSKDEKNLYVVDKNNHVIRQIELATGKVTTLAGIGRIGYREGKFNKAAFSLPEYLKLGDDGNLYISEAGSLRVRRLDLTKKETSLVSGSGERGAVNGAGAKAEWNGPKGFAFLNGVMYVADFYNDQIRTVLSTGTAPSTTPSPKLSDKVAPGASLMAYNSKLRGNWAIATGNVTGDAKEEIITGTGQGMGSEVKIFDNKGNKLASFFAYAKNSRAGVRVAAGDIDGDGYAEILTVPGPGAVPQIRIFNGSGQLEGSFSALDGKFKGGAYLASGDVNGDGKAEIVVTAGKGGGAQVTVHQANGRVIANFFAYNKKTFRKGITVAVLDTDGDGIDEIITGPEFGAPHIQFFSLRAGKIKQLNPGFYAFSPQYRGGVFVTGGDYNGDGKDEIIVAVGLNAEPHIKIFNKEGTILLKEFRPFAKAFKGGAIVASGDVDNDGKDEVVVMPRSKGGPNFRIIEVDQL